MQIKITNEQPFQILGTTFTIGPSSSGYDLMFSADGITYSKLFTVGANTNRQVTQVAAGSYYYLDGNTDEVTVNWMKDCGGGGGGGSYVLPAATQDTLGGIKVGSGLNIDSEGTLSSAEATILDLAAVSAMTNAERIALWDEVYAKVASGESVFIKGQVQGENGRTAIIPVVSYRGETNAETHVGGNIYFAGKGDTDLIYFHINLGSDGSILPVEGMIKREMVQKATSDTLGLVKIGAGLTIDSGGTLSSEADKLEPVDALPATAVEGEVRALKVNSYYSNVVALGLLFAETYVGPEEDKDGYRLDVLFNEDVPVKDAPVYLGYLAPYAEIRYPVYGQYESVSAFTLTVGDLNDPLLQQTVGEGYTGSTEQIYNATIWFSPYYNGDTGYTHIDFYASIGKIEAAIPNIGTFQYAHNQNGSAQYWKPLNIEPKEYTLPVASNSTLGGIKIGSGLTIDSGGTVSVSGGTSGGDSPVKIYNYNDFTGYSIPGNKLREMVAAASGGAKVYLYYVTNSTAEADSYTYNVADYAFMQLVEMRKAEYGYKTILKFQGGGYACQMNWQGNHFSNYQLSTPQAYSVLGVIDNYPDNPPIGTIVNKRDVFGGIGVKFNVNGLIPEGETTANAFDLRYNVNEEDYYLSVSVEMKDWDDEAEEAIDPPMLYINFSNGETEDVHLNEEETSGDMPLYDESDYYYAFEYHTDTGEVEIHLYDGNEEEMAFAIDAIENNNCGAVIMNLNDYELVGLRQYRGINDDTGEPDWVELYAAANDSE